MVLGGNKPTSALDYSNIPLKDVDPTPQISNLFVEDFKSVVEFYESNKQIIKLLQNDITV